MFGSVTVHAYQAIPSTDRKQQNQTQQTKKAKIYFVRTVATKYHELGGWNNINLLFYKCDF
jgi:hypothetical protein